MTTNKYGRTKLFAGYIRAFVNVLPFEFSNVPQYNSKYPLLIVHELLYVIIAWLNRITYIDKQILKQ